jgi:hypothetical protein
MLMDREHAEHLYSQLTLRDAGTPDAYALDWEEP